MTTTLVITRSNHRHLAEHVALVAQHGVQSLLLSAAAARGNAHTDLARVVPRVASVAHELRPAADLAAQLGLPLFVRGLPACLIPEFTAVPLELFGPRWVELPHVQGPPCEGCAWRRWCPGLESVYAARYGFSELRPATEDDQATVARAREQGRSPAAARAGLGPTEPLTETPDTPP